MKANYSKLATATFVMTGICLLLFGRQAPADEIYTYDRAGRLILVDYGNGAKVRYSYDGAGNLLSQFVERAAPVSRVQAGYQAVEPNHMMGRQGPDQTRTRVAVSRRQPKPSLRRLPAAGRQPSRAGQGRP